MKYRIKCKIQLQENKYESIPSNLYKEYLESLEYYIEAAKEFELPFHPNLTDKFNYYSCVWEINEICMNLEDDSWLSNVIELHKCDCGHIAKSRKNENRIKLVKEFVKTWSPDGWDLIDYYLGKDNIDYSDILKEIKIDEEK